MEISYRISWRRSSGAGGSCSSTGTFLNGEGSLVCQYGCSGTIGPMSYFCTDYSASEDWSFGERTLTYNFGSLSGIVAIGFTGGCWISPLGCSWNISTTFSLAPRGDIGEINSSPQAITVPVLRLQEGCPHTIPLAVSDPNGDTVRCRWAAGVECAGICGAFPGATLDAATCTLSYLANQGPGFRAAAIMVEDFLPGSSQPLSSVAFQFLVLVVSSTQACNQNPVFVDPTPANGICATIPAGGTFTAQLTADSGSSTIQISEIQTVSPLGTQRGSLQRISNTNQYFVTLTWTPQVNQQNQTHLLCYTAVSSVGSSSSQVCIQLAAGYTPPTPFPGTAIPTQQQLRLSEITMQIDFNNTVQRPSSSAYIIFYDFNTNQEVYRIDTSSSSEVTFQLMSITVVPSYMFTPGNSYYINLQRGVVQSVGACGSGISNEPVTAKTFWTFAVMGMLTDSIVCINTWSVILIANSFVTYVSVVLKHITYCRYISIVGVGSNALQK